MDRRDAGDLAEAIGRFIDGDDQSGLRVSEIEGIVIECCQDQYWFDSVSEALALFVPGGGSYYLDETQLEAELRPLLAVLRSDSEDAE